MGFSNNLRVLITGDTKGLERSFARANQATVQFGRNVDSTAAKADKGFKSMRGFATGAATGFAGALVVGEATRQIGAAITAASSLQEQMAATNVVFEDSAGTILKWSESTASSIGIASDQALLAANTFGGMFDAAGATSADAARLSKTVVQLAADLASFKDTTVDEALTALRSGLSGEVEPLRRYQVFLTEASVAQKAMEQTGKSNAKQLTQGEKILARYTLVMEQTVKAQGDQARTAESFANQQRKLAAQTRDLQAAIGTLLLPAMTELVSTLNTATTGALALADGLKALAGVEIPEIEIPFNITIGGQSIGDLAGSGFNFLKNTPLNPLWLPTLANTIADQFRDQAESPGVTNDLANKFAKSINTLTTNALDTAAKQASKTKTKVAAFGQKGFKELPENTLGEDLERQFNATLDALNLKLDKTAVTKTGKDDLAVLNELEKVIRERIKSHGRTTDLLRLLFQVDQQRATVLQGEATAAADAREETKRRLAELTEQRKEIARLAQEARQASEFKRIGLTATGGEIIPGLDNLRKQFSQLSKNIVGQDVPKKLRDRLRLVGDFLRSGIKSAEEPTRVAIRDLFNMIRDEFDKGTKKGPLTKTSSLNANKVLDGLGLGPDQEREIRARLSSFNTAGRSLGGATRPTGNFVPQRVDVTVNNTTTLDGEVVSRNTTKQQQKNRRRNPRQKRGPNSRSGI